MAIWKDESPVEIAIEKIRQARAKGASRQQKSSNKLRPPHSNSQSEASISNCSFRVCSFSHPRISFDFTVGGVNQSLLPYNLIDQTNYNKFAIYYKQNEFKLYVNGLLVAIDSSGNVPSSGTFTELAFDDGGGGSDFYGRVKKLSVYNDTTQDLEKLTGFTSFAEMSSYLSYS